MPEKAGSSRTSLWLLGALCAAPVAASYIAFYMLPPARHTNHGDLLETRPLPPAHLQLADGTPFQLGELKGKWLLLMADAGSCDEFCRRKLFNLRQLRLTQGKNMERIARVWLITDNALPRAEVTSDYSGTWLVRAAGSEVLQALPSQGVLADHIFIIDPLGNLVMRYARDAEPAGIIKDLERLLRTSGIG
jgi:cytochrome oxidase Cu insertion factor (SCO1/SenC/PrrC family)